MEKQKTEIILNFIVRRLPLPVAAVAVAAVLLHGGLSAARPRLVAYEIVVPGLPPEQDGVRIALISDLHVTDTAADRKLLERAARLVDRIDPDLTLLAGDYCNRHWFNRNVPPERLAAVCRRFRARSGVFAVTGNHDASPAGDGVPAALAAAGVTLLNNRAVTIPLRGQPLQLAGTEDSGTRKDDLAAAMRGLDPARPFLLLTHNPDLFMHWENRAAVTFAGHLHGGQFRLPWLGAAYRPDRRPLRFWRGLYRRGGRQLLLTSGLGTSLLPLRILCPPEVTAVTLRSPKP